jgi:DNA invertase Pin-like site-specific DNA recombinase
MQPLSCVLRSKDFSARSPRNRHRCPQFPLLGVFAEFETNLRRERQLEGIAKAKAEGVYKGRKPSINQGKVEKLRADGLGATEIAKRLKIGRASVCRVLAS